MKKSVLVLPISLAAALGLSLLAAIALRSLLPRLILPRLDIPTVVLLCLLAALADHYLAGGAEHNGLALFLLGGLCFALLPLCAGAVPWQQALRLAVVGSAVLPLTSAALTAACRDSHGLRPWVVALGWYLAAQAFRGVWI